MKKSILIISGFPDNEDQKQSFLYFTSIYKKFFMSNAGGAFNEDEIMTLSQPSTIELKELVLSKKSDFQITILIGHGATQENNQLFKINKNEIIKAGQLYFDIEKQIID